MNLEDIYNDLRFVKYFDMLTEWNKSFNLTSVTKMEDVFLKHFFDSVLPLDSKIQPALFDNGARVLDIGSGAGFPGICLKLVRPDLDITLVEATGKKVLFLNTVIDKLNLSKIRTAKTRIEDFNQKNFDHVVARALAPLNTLVEYCLPFLKLGGTTILYKSATVQDELSAAQKTIAFLGGSVEKVLFLPLDKEILRSFVVIKKIKETPAGFPRSGNKPKLSPLFSFSLKS